MKRIISCLLAILLMLSTSVVAFAENESPANGSDEPTFTVSSVEANPGKDVSVTIRMDHNPGVASVKLKVQFDGALTLNAITYNTELGGMSQQPQSFTSPVTLNWFNGEANTTGDMTYAVLNFTVAQDATAGLHAVTITYDADDVYCINEQKQEVNVAFAVENGGVNVTFPVVGLALNPTAATVSTGDGTYTLTPVFTPSDATNQNLSWESSQPSLATVSDGVVTLLKKGEVVITATSEDGGFTASCTLTILCSHLSCNDVPADASTCIHQGHGAYTICADCGVIVSGSDALLPYGAHQYHDDPQPEYLKSAANCVSPAVYYKSCSVCGVKGTETFTYGEIDPDQHAPADAVNENVIPAICLQAGEHDEVVYCSDCGEALSSEHVIDQALGHAFGDPVWEWVGFDSATATFSCIRGDDQHTLTATIGSEVTKEPSGTEDGVRTYTATVTFDETDYTDVKTEVIPRRILIGDADADGDVTILDATAIQRYLANLRNVSFDALAADADEDDDLTILDATAIQRYLAALSANPRIGTYK